MTTWSLTPFFNELDVLEIRLATLDPVVDVHVISESPLTYSGEEKPLHLDSGQARDRLWPWRHKIRRVVVEDSPRGMSLKAPRRALEASESDCWRRENHQREALKKGCEGMQDDDLVLLSDLDEIVAPAEFNRVGADLSFHPILRPRLSLHVYYLNWRWPRPLEVIARFMRGRTLKALGPQVARLETGMAYGSPMAGDGLGWHLSYMGGLEAIQHKLRCAAHHEVAGVAEEITHLETCMATGIDLFGRPDRLSEWVGLEHLPPVIGENPERWRHLMIERPREVA